VLVAKLILELLLTNLHYKIANRQNSLNQQQANSNEQQHQNICLNSNQQQRLSIIPETPAPFALSTFIQPDEQQLIEKKKKNPFLSVDDLEESESFNFQPKKLLPSQSFQSGDCVYATSLQPYVLGQ
jgi:hypothetical protein